MNRFHIIVRGRFQNIVSAIVYSVIRERCAPEGPDDDFPHNRVVRFVTEQHGRMAPIYRIPFLGLAFAFDALCVLKHGGVFHRLDHEDRRAWIAAWRGSPLPPCRDFIRLFESLAVFSWYSEVAPSREAEQAGRAPGRADGRPRAAA